MRIEAQKMPASIRGAFGVFTAVENFDEFLHADDLANRLQRESVSRASRARGRHAALRERGATFRSLQRASGERRGRELRRVDGCKLKRHKRRAPIEIRSTDFSQLAAIPSQAIHQKSFRPYYYRVRVRSRTSNNSTPWAGRVSTVRLSRSGRSCWRHTSRARRRSPKPSSLIRVRAWRRS